MDINPFILLGLISRSGFVILDDSLSVELDNDEWPWVIAPSPAPTRLRDEKYCAAIPAKERRVCGYNVLSEVVQLGTICN
jgi:hypothetical protein